MKKIEKLRQLNDKIKKMEAKKIFDNYNKKSIEYTKGNINILKSYITSRTNYKYENEVIKINDLDIKKFINKTENNSKYDLRKFKATICDKKNPFSIINNEKTYYDYLNNTIFINKNNKEKYYNYIFHMFFHISSNGFKFNKNFISLNEGMTQRLTLDNFSSNINNNIHEYEMKTIDILSKVYNKDILTKIYFEENPKDLYKLLNLYLNDNDIIKFICASDEYYRINKTHKKDDKKLLEIKKQYNKIICKTLCKIIINKHDDLELDQMILLLKDSYPELIEKINLYNDDILLFEFLKDVYYIPVFKTVDKIYSKEKKIEKYIKEN